jgi:hypothetical protein
VVGAEGAEGGGQECQARVYRENLSSAWALISEKSGWPRKAISDRRFSEGESGDSSSSWRNAPNNDQPPPLSLSLSLSLSLCLPHSLAQRESRSPRLGSPAFFYHSSPRENRPRSSLGQGSQVRENCAHRSAVK